MNTTARRRPPPSRRPRAGGSGRSGYDGGSAREGRGVYDTGAPGGDGRTRGRRREPGAGAARSDRLRSVAADLVTHDRPPVLEDAPTLADLLNLVGLVDRVIALAVDRLIDLRTTGEVEDTTGVSVELWLAQVARRTSSDVRMLLAASELLPRLPATHAAFLAGELSWSQVRAVVLACKRLRASALEEADSRVQRWVASTADAAPETVTRGLAQLAWEMDEEAERRRLDRDELAAERDEFVSLQPRLDGSGGRFFGEAGALNFALLEAALDQGLDIPAGGGSFVTSGDRPAQSRAAGSQRAARLFSWAADHLAGNDTGSDAPDPGTPAGTLAPRTVTRGAGVAGRAGLLLRMELSTLLGGGLPGELLTTLTGGRLRLSASASRRLAEAGVDLRTIVVDESGAVVGVGRATRRPPGWLRDAALLLNASCTGPCCRAAARIAALDHAQPWSPVHPDDPPGTTDIANIGPLCGRQNRTKESEGWQVTGSPDGGRVWHHPRSGIVYRHLPDRWVPPATGDPPGGDRLGTDPPDDVWISDLLDPPDPSLPF